MARIGFDLDGVIYNFGAAVEHYINISRTPLAELIRSKIHGHLGHEGPYPAPQVWDWYEDQWGLTHAEFKAICDEGVDEGVIFSWGEPARGAKQVIDSLRDAGHDIVFITARDFGTIPGQVEVLTVRWLQTYGLFVPGIDSLHFDADKTGFGLDYMLEDNVDNLRALRDDGAIAVCMSRPWNVEWDGLDVGSLDEFVAVVEENEAARIGVEEPVRIIRDQSAHPWIALSGRKRSGKDTVGNYLVEHYGFTKVSFADLLKSMALAIDPVVRWKASDMLFNPVHLSEIVEWYGWEDAKDRFPEVRRFLQRLGTEGVRNHLGDNVWVDAAERAALEVDGPVVFCDARFPNEAEMVKRNGGEVWRVERPGTDVGDPHPSESALDDWDFDMVLDNDGPIGKLNGLVSEALAYRGLR